MNNEPDITTIGKLLSDPSRAAILMVLMSGKALTAGEIAKQANISAQVVSNQLKKLVNAGLVVFVKAVSRFRYYKLTSPKIAELLESLSLVAMPETKTVSSTKLAFRFARTCYDHLAGKVGIQIMDAFIKKNFFINNDDSLNLTTTGERYFNKIGINVEHLRREKTVFLKCCLDCTERKYHFRGSLAKAFLEYLIAEKILKLSTNQNRVLLLTGKGKQWLAELSSL